LQGNGPSTYVPVAVDPAMKKHSSSFSNNVSSEQVPMPIFFKSSMPTDRSEFLNPDFFR